MKSICLCALLWCVFACVAESGQVLTITGPIVAPWVKGQICVGYHRVNNCLSIGAGKTYRFILPDTIDRIKVTRSFGKTCKVSRRGKVVCDTVRGKFNVPDDGTLVLSYDNSKVYKFYTIPPQEPISNYGWPQQNPSIEFRHLQMSDPSSVF